MEKFTKRILVCLIAVMMVLCSSICFASGVIGLPEGTKMKGLELQADGTYKYWQKGLEDYVYNEWKKIDGKKYYFDEHGTMATGAKEIDGEYYFFNSDGTLEKEITEAEWAQHMVRATGTLETNPAGESYHQADNYYQDILDEHHEYVAESIDESIQVKLEEEDRLTLIQDERYDLMELNTIVRFSDYKPNAAQLTEIDRVIAKFKEDYIKPGMSDFEKEMAIIQYIVATNTYDCENYAKHLKIEAGVKTKEKPNPDTYTAYGALVKGRSVCAGYANAFNMLCSACGLESAILSGPTKENCKCAHAWNMVKLDGEWYLVDVTWADGYRISESMLNQTKFNFPDHYIADYEEFENEDEEVELKFVNVRPLDVPCTATKYGPKVVAYYLATGKVDTNPPETYETVLEAQETMPHVTRPRNNEMPTPEYSDDFWKQLGSLRSKAYNLETTANVEEEDIEEDVHEEDEE